MLAISGMLGVTSIALSVRITAPVLVEGVYLNPHVMVTTLGTHFQRDRAYRGRFIQFLQTAAIRNYQLPILCVMS